MLISWHLEVGARTQQLARHTARMLAPCVGYAMKRCVATSSRGATLCRSSGWLPPRYSLLHHEAPSSHYRSLLSVQACASKYNSIRHIPLQPLIHGSLFIASLLTPTPIRSTTVASMTITILAITIISNLIPRMQHLSLSPARHRLDPLHGLPPPPDERLEARVHIRQFRGVRPRGLVRGNDVRVLVVVRGALFAFPRGGRGRGRIGIG
jgi:hypothetical protein